MPELKNIKAGDDINYKGVDYSIASVTSVTNDGYGNYTAIVVLGDGHSTSLTLKNSDTVLSSFHVPSATNTEIATWVQTKNA